MLPRSSLEMEIIIIIIIETEEIIRHRLTEEKFNPKWRGILTGSIYCLRPGLL